MSKALAASGGGRALPDLISRIRVDSSGVDAAVMSLIKGFGKADIALAATAAGIGILLVGAKSMYETYEKISTSESGLTQAVSAHNSAIGTQATKSADLAKAQKELSQAQKQLNEYDLAHHATAAKTSEDLKGHESDLKKAAAASKGLTSAQNALDSFDRSHTGHVMNAAQLAQREALLQRVQTAQGNLTSTNREAATVDSVTTRGHQLTALELAHRQDLLDKVSDAQKAVNDETAAGGADTRSQSLSLDAVQGSADRLISTNRRFISDQSEVYDGYAKLIRGGLDLTETQRVMNDAIDLAALKHISLSEATDILNAAEHGRLRGLIDLGITTKQLTDADGNLLGGQRAITAAMGEVDQKVADGRDTLGEAAQNSNQLNNDWQDLSRKGGPVIETLLDTIVTSLISVYNWFDAIGKNDELWGAISDRLVKMSNWINQYLVQPMQHFQEQMAAGIPQNERYSSAAAAKARGVYSPFNDPKSSLYLFGIAGGTQAFGKGGRASGGPVLPGGSYTVGEDEEETLVMDPSGRGGMVIPSGKGRSGGTVNITVHAKTNADPREIAAEIGWELRKLRRAW